MIFYYFVLVHGRLITRLKTIYTTRNNLVTEKNGFGRASSILVHLSSMLCKSASWNIPVKVLKTTGAFNSESFIANESFKIFCTNTVSDYCQSYWANFIGCTHRQNNPVPSRPLQNINVKIPHFDDNASIKSQFNRRSFRSSWTHTSPTSTLKFKDGGMIAK